MGFTKEGNMLESQIAALKYQIQTLLIKQGIKLKGS